MSISKGNINASSFAKWSLACLIIGTFTGTSTALFLASLDIVTEWRVHHEWIIYSLPLSGFIIASIYNTDKNLVQKGTNLLLEEHQVQKKKIPWKMAPIVLFSTLLTHLSGGSAGREGTAVQMGGAIADQCTLPFTFNARQRKTILVLGVSAGFAAVFGTPIAGALFALEIMLFKYVDWRDVLPSIVTAFIAHFTCISWGIEHTNYTISHLPSISINSILWSLLSGMLFGFIAYLFTQTNQIWTLLFKPIKNKILLTVLGGMVLVFAIQFMDTTKYIGLGIPTIVDAFQNPAGNFDFILKLLFTTFTLSVGFKGGEVTPLFFIGACFGNILYGWIPLPMSLLAGMGFVAVFAGATHCSIASIILGIELFGIEAGIYIGIASTVAYFSSGLQGIYSAQRKEGAKYKLYNYIKRVAQL